MPMFSRADTSTNMTSPPYSSATRPNSVSCWRTLAGLASGLSILFTATTIGTFADCAWFSASTVCGMMPSSAATTRIAMSVTCAPRARMAVNASWPGVSMKVIARSMPSCSVCTWYAPMCWVMPPASPATTFALRIASRSRVLPWSTWPMTVTTGGRISRSSSVSSSSSWSRSMAKPSRSSRSSSSGETTWIL